MWVLSIFKFIWNCVIVWGDEGVLSGINIFRESDVSVDCWCGGGVVVVGFRVVIL